MAKRCLTDAQRSHPGLEARVDVEYLPADGRVLEARPRIEFTNGAPAARQQIDACVTSGLRALAANRWQRVAIHR
ncbi:MAG: hypothetical protein U0326_42650 [Polyangiales bacterium]